MITFNRTPPALMREAHRRELQSAPAPEVLNLDQAIALTDPDAAPPPLVWDGASYGVKRISYAEGLRLQRVALRLDAMSRNPPTTVEDVEDAEAFIEEATNLFHALLDPRPAANPFFDATPLEVGALLGFFCACQMRQRGPSWARIATPHRTT